MKNIYESWTRINEKKEREIYFAGFCDYFMTSFRLTKTIPIPILKFWNSHTFPIPIRTEVGCANLFLFLFAREKLFAEHWFGVDGEVNSIQKFTIVYNRVH